MLHSTMSIAVMLFAGSGLAVDHLKSGPQVGEDASRFAATFMNGDQAGQKRCPV